MGKAVIIGAGTQGQVLCSYLLEANVDIIGFIDDSTKIIGSKVNGIPVLGCYNDLLYTEFKKNIDDVYCPIGNNKIRTAYLSRLKEEGYETPSFIHPTVCIGPDVELGTAVYMLPGNIIMPHTKIGNFFMMNTCSTIAHHVHVEDGVFLSSGVNVGALINVRKNAYIGMGVTAMTGIKEIGMDTLLGAGAVVIRDVPDYATVVGNPARVIKYKKPNS